MKLSHRLVLAGWGKCGEPATPNSADVALKILPEQFATDPDRLARFKREAQVLASLNHPNIGGIHGLEETDGVRALVLELVEGPTLGDRIAQGPIPLDEALVIAKQIAEALEVAHEQGIIHRDLKPANIKLRPDGSPRPKEAPPSSADASRRTAHDAGDLSTSPCAGVALWAGSDAAEATTRNRPDPNSKSGGHSRENGSGPSSRRQRKRIGT